MSGFTDMLNTYRDAEISMQQRLEFKCIFVFILDNQGGSQCLGCDSNSVVQSERVRPGWSLGLGQLMVLQGCNTLLDGKREFWTRESAQLTESHRDFIIVRENTDIFPVRVTSKTYDQGVVVSDCVFQCHVILQALRFYRAGAAWFSHQCQKLGKQREYHHE